MFDMYMEVAIRPIPPRFIHLLGSRKRGGNLVTENGAQWVFAWWDRWNGPLITSRRRWTKQRYDGNRLIIAFLFRTRPGLFWGETKKRSRIRSSEKPSTELDSRSRADASPWKRTRRKRLREAAFTTLRAPPDNLPEIKPGKLTERESLRNASSI